MENVLNIMKRVFLVHNINPGIGGMESHQKAFVEYFFYRKNMFNYIIEKNGVGAKVYEYNKDFRMLKPVITLDYQNLVYEWLKEQNSNVTFVFFLNDPWWIEDVPLMRNIFPYSLIIMRSGGNDVEKAPCNQGIYPYKERRNKYKEFINMMDHIIANSEFSINRLKRLGIKDNKIIKIRGGVNTQIADNIKSQNELNGKLRKELLKYKSFIVLYACRFVEFKGIIESLYALTQSNIADDVMIIFVGDGPLRHKIEEFCRSHFSASQYLFVGVAENDTVLKYMAVSDVVINASLELTRKSDDGEYIHTETMGRSMMEAISVGTHIIATDVGGTRELFQENEGIGFLVKTTSNSLTDAFNSISQILNIPIKIKEDYSWNHVFNEYEKLINEHEIDKFRQSQNSDNRNQCEASV